ncbi:hypothetical protein [Spiribacter insolitus]|uniref:Alginate export domain-containing protein n=1 Tax=Spiribacter insolitus TaxID=3122417 RepID=A0ABV3T6A8_9GAMM
MKPLDRMTRDWSGGCWRSVLTALLVIAVLSPLKAQESAEAEDPWGDEAWGDDPWTGEKAGWQWYGFIDGATASRIHDDPAVGDDYTLNETRLQLEGERPIGDYTATVKADVWIDGVEDGVRGDLREAALAGRLTERMDIDVGRQILTWGTGDLVFLNDLFPKDYVSFFSGRDDEYLKAPADALRLSWFGDVNVDFVWMPRAAPNRYITGERLSYFSVVEGRRVAAPPEIDPRERDSLGRDSEVALRVYQTIDSVEYAGYAYHGYDNQPSAVDPSTGEAYSPRLTSLGASLRRPVLGGIGNLETAYYSGEDSSGDDPNLPNDQWRFLGGFENEPFADFTLGWQYLLEWTRDHDALVANLPAAQRPYAPDEYRHLLTNRITWQLLRQDLTLSLFTFYSPSDADYYLRPRAIYRFSDQLTGTAGGNLFGGADDWTFHTQLEDNSNLYLRLRYSF